MRLPRVGAVLILMCGLLAACNERKPVDQPPPPSRGVRPAVEPEQAEEAPSEEPEAPDPPPDWQQPPAAEQPPAEPAAAEGTAQEAPEEDKPPPRDYGAELRSLITDASSCMKRRTDPNAPAEVTVSIEAVVMEGGMVTRSYARASALDGEETACLQRKVGALHMQAPVENAPRTVNTSITLQLQRAPARPAAAPTEGMGETPPAAPEAQPGAPPDPYAIPKPLPGTPAERPSQPDQPQ